MKDNKFFEFGNRIKALRERQGIKQGQFADEIGISRQSMSNYESGKHSPDVEVIAKIADYFNCSVDYLFGRSEHPNSQEQSYYNQDFSRLADSLLELPLPLREAWLAQFIATTECVKKSLGKEIKSNFDLFSLYVVFIKMMNLCLDTEEKRKEGIYNDKEQRKANDQLHQYLNTLRGEINYLDNVFYQFVNSSMEK